jgi:arylamine N-acetyltransferase
LQLRRYFERIGFAGNPRPDIQTLREIHRRHVTSIPYENLDVQFGVSVSRAPHEIFEKLVIQRRGGWCFEMNGLLAWALEKIGFEVERLAGAVHRESRGNEMIGNHLVLLIDLGETWLADTGYGDGLIEPVLLKEGPFNTGPFQCRLDKITDGWWRYQNDPNGSAPSFDFNPNLPGEDLLELSCHSLQTDPFSSFVLNAVVQRWVSDEHLSLRGRVFTHTSSRRKKSRIVRDSQDYVRVLKQDFNLDLPRAATLWPKICERHAAIFNQNDDVVPAHENHR